MNSSKYLGIALISISVYLFILFSLGKYFGLYWFALSGWSAINLPYDPFSLFYVLESWFILLIIVLGFVSSFKLLRVGNLSVKIITSLYVILLILFFDFVHTYIPIISDIIGFIHTLIFLVFNYEIGSSCISAYGSRDLCLFLTNTFPYLTTLFFSFVSGILLLKLNKEE